MLTLFVKWLSTSGGETSEKDQAQFYVIVITVFNFIYGVLTLGISNLAESSARMWRGAGTREKKRRKVKIRVLNYEPIDDWNKKKVAELLFFFQLRDTLITIPFY